MIHELKIEPRFFEAIESGKKNFEVRKSDRHYFVGDYLALNECDKGTHTGRAILAEVTYLLDDEEYCKKGYVVMGIRRCKILPYQQLEQTERGKEKQI